MASSSKTDYPCIRAWERMFRAGEYYIQQVLMRAREEKAPEDAIYWSADRKKWSVLGDITSNETRWWFKQNYPDLVAKYTDWEKAA